jgi:hypothetical protein
VEHVVGAQGLPANLPCSPRVHIRTPLSG